MDEHDWEPGVSELSERIKRKIDDLVARKTAEPPPPRESWREWVGRLVVTSIEIAELPIVERLADAERRIAELEARPSTQYRGIYDDKETYRRGDFVTRSGSVWHCELDRAKGVVPGTDALGWRLAVKRGADGRDAR